MEQEKIKERLYTLDLVICLVYAAIMLFWTQWNESPMIHIILMSLMVLDVIGVIVFFYFVIKNKVTLRHKRLYIIGNAIILWHLCYLLCSEFWWK